MDCSFLDINNLSFNNNNISIILDDKNEPWFKAKDIAIILEYSSVHKYIKHIDKEDKKILGEILYNDIKTLTCNEINTIYINEPGLYSLILSSKKEEAKKFKKWITTIVLPSIHKYKENKLKKEIETISNNFQEQLYLKDQIISSLLASNNTLENFVNNVKTKNKSSYIYIVTSASYASKNIFKVGKTDNLKNKLLNYNIDRNIDKFYYCFFERVYNPNKIESIISDILEDFKDKKEKEIVVLHYNYLLGLIKLVIKNIDEAYEYLNILINNNFLTMYNLEPIIPKEINLDNLELIELRNKITNLLDNCIENNQVNLIESENESI